MFYGYKELALFMFDLAERGLTTVAALYYSEAKLLLKELLKMKMDELEVSAIELIPVEYNGYNKEYYITLADDMVLGVEPAWSDDRYLVTCADIVFVDANASSAILQINQDSLCFETDVL